MCIYEATVNVLGLYFIIVGLAFILLLYEGML